MKRERKIDGEQEKINYLRLHGELQIPVVEINQKMQKKCILEEIFPAFWKTLGES